MLNKCVFQGRLVAEPELRMTANNIAVLSFCVAVDRDIKDADGNRPADFIECVAWRGKAEFISKYFTKGSPIVIAGSIQTRMYDGQDGKRHKVTEVLAEQAYFCGEGKKDGGKPADLPAAPMGGDEFAVVADDGQLPF